MESSFKMATIVMNSLAVVVSGIMGFSKEETIPI